MIGKKFHSWTIIAEDVKQRPFGDYRRIPEDDPIVLAKCECGKLRSFSISALEKGLNKSCDACRNRKRQQLEHRMNLELYQGKKYGSWLVIGDCDPDGKKIKGRVFCRCDCGFEKFIFFCSIKDSSAGKCCQKCSKLKSHGK